MTNYMCTFYIICKIKNTEEKSKHCLNKSTGLVNLIELYRKMIFLII